MNGALVGLAAIALAYQAEPGVAVRARADGARAAWYFRIPEDAGHLGTPAFGHGTVYVGSGLFGDELYALDAATGAVRFRHDLVGASGARGTNAPAPSSPDQLQLVPPPAVLGSDRFGGGRGSVRHVGLLAPVVIDDDVYAGTETGTLFALGRDGSRRWERRLRAHLTSQPAAHGTRLVSETADGTGPRLVGLDRATGDLLWAQPTPGPLIAAPVLHGNAAYVSTWTGDVLRIELRSGHLRWGWGVGATTAPWVEDGRVYVARVAPGSTVEETVALDAESGLGLATYAGAAAPDLDRVRHGGHAGLWAYEGARPIVVDGVLHQSFADELRATDVDTGRVLWSRGAARGGALRALSVPAIADGLIVVGTADGVLHGVDRATGRSRWAFAVGEPILAQPILAGGWVYATTAAGGVVGIDLRDPTLPPWPMWGGSPAHDGT